MNNGTTNADLDSKYASYQATELAIVKAELAELRNRRQKEREMFQLVIDSSPGVLWTMEPNGLPTVLSRAPKSTEKLLWAQVESQGWSALVTEEEKSKAAAEWEAKLQAQLPFEVEWQLRQQDGSLAWYELTARPLAGTSGRAVRWFGSCRNIDAEKKLVETLQSSLRTRSDFVAHVSHELRTPLNGILPMIELMLRGQLSDETRAHAMTLREAGGTLLHVINEILDFSKLEAGKLKANKIDFNLVSLVEGVAQILTPAAATKNLLLLSTIDGNVPEYVSGDTQKLRQVLLNLCGNAIKFTDQGQVVLRVSIDSSAAKPHSLVFTVMDTGPGIDEETMGLLFEPFCQGSGEAFRNKAGTGLGLSISKQLVELMEGNIFVQGETGTGATFGFTMPLPPGTDGDVTGVWDMAVSENFKRDLLVLEPCIKRQWEISNALQSIGMRVKPFADPDTLLEFIKHRKNVSPEYLAVVVDMVRYRNEGSRFLEKLANCNLPRPMRTIEVVLPNQSCMMGDSSGDCTARLTLPMPLQRNAMIKCLSTFEAALPTRAERTCSTTTLQMRHLPAIDLSERLQPGRKKIALVGDDNEINRRVVQLFLVEMGFQVDLANDGVEAVQAFKSKRYDLVFLDCQMPRLDGFGAAKIIKEVQARKGIAVPVIALTANAAEGTREHCLANDMDDYLSKPIEPQALEKLVETWLGSTPQKQDIRNETQLLANTGSRSLGIIVDLRKLRSSYKDSQIKSLLEVYVESGTETVQEIGKELSMRDYTLCERKLGTLKDSSIMIEAAPIVAACDQLALAIQRHDTSGSQASLRRICELMDRIKKEVIEAFADRCTTTVPMIQRIS